jgi:hypothetical protein
MSLNRVGTLTPNFAEWQITLERVPMGAGKLTGFGEDAAGNNEKTPRVMTVVAPR